MKLFTSAIAAVVALVSLHSTAYAHFIWATVDKNQARFALLEDIGEAPNAKFEKYVTGLAPRSGGKTLKPGSIKDGAQYSTLASGQNVVVADSIVGAKEREGEAYLLVYHAKGAASLQAASTDAKAPAELLAKQEGTDLVVTVKQGGWPVPSTEVWVQWPGDANPTSFTTDVAGQARIPWAKEKFGGFVGVRAMVSEKKAGENVGVKYTAIHHWATLTFPVDGPKPVAPAAVAASNAVAPGTEKPFTQVLRASYAHNHEVVGNAAFNKTLFDGKLTKDQLEVHLQQRALIHNELHRILNAADPAKHVPYGAAQKNVLVLLFNDLITMGSGWPTEAQARPLTKAFLQEIRDSESKGPFFALGVQHIYFGGITNGGRMIGAKIGETIKFTPSYYEKSDGYREYLPAVDKITDPEAQKEMIRGGQAAYKYIIESSNEDIFQSKVTKN